MKLLLFSVIFAFPLFCCAQQSGAKLNQVAVGQGISSPALTNTALFSNGFTYENPVGVSYQDQYRLTASIDGADSSSFGTEFGVGDTKYGFALGAYSNACDGCEAYIRGTMSAIWGWFALGFGVQEDLYTLGIMIDPESSHRIGLVGEFNEPNGINNDRSSVGFGYSYVLPQFTFALDMSYQFFENNQLADDTIVVTPGFVVRVDIFTLSLNYDAHISDTQNQYADQVWVGVSARPFKNWEFTFYGEYVDRWTLMTSFFF